MKTKKTPPKPKRRTAHKPVTTFKVGNQAATKFTEETVIPVLEEMDRILCTNHETGEMPDNPCRANKIKLVGELCLLVGLKPRTFTHWQKKFCKEQMTVNETYKDDYGRTRTRKEQVPNPCFSWDISDLICRIRDICEVRICYSGTRMDMFLLKKHYGFLDNPTKTKDNSAQAPVVPIPQMPIIRTVVVKE